MAALEAAVSELQRRLAAPAPDNWLQRITGTFKDDPEFDEVIRLGREFREADRPREDEADAP